MSFYGFLFDYLSSAWGLAVLALSTAVFGLKAYDIFAKNWPATTGRHATKGHITWSEFVDPAWKLAQQVVKHGGNDGLVSYSYRVDGLQHNGTIPLKNLSRAEIERDLYKGAEIDVYYSPRLPQYSYPRRPPSRWHVAQQAIFFWMLFPLVPINGVSFFIWYLAHA